MERVCEEREREGGGLRENEKEREGMGREGQLASTSSCSDLNPGIMLDVPAPLDTVWKRTKEIN